MQFTTNKPFDPITIILTSQAEVDFYYTLVVNAPDAMVGDFGIGAEVDMLAEFLECYASGDCFEEHEVEDFYPPLDEPVDAGPAGKNTSMYEHKPKILGELQREHPCKSGCEACKGCNAAESNYEGFAPVGKSFQPFYVKVHNQETANYLAALVGATGSEIDTAFGVHEDVYELYDFLRNHAEEEGPRVETDLINNRYN